MQIIAKGSGDKTELEANAYYQLLDLGSDRVSEPPWPVFVEEVGAKPPTGQLWRERPEQAWQSQPGHGSANVRVGEILAAMTRPFLWRHSPLSCIEDL